MTLLRLLALITTFLLGITTVWIFSTEAQLETTPPAPVNHQESGYGRTEAAEFDVLPPGQRIVTTPLRIIHKEKAQYTDLARSNGIQGTVTLRVTFLASGEVGTISVVKSLPDGLTEQSIAAARQIRFEPEMVGAVARTTTRPVSYTFNIY